MKDEPMFCKCGRIKSAGGPFYPQCSECMADLRVSRPEWFNADGSPIIKRERIEAATKAPSEPVPADIEAGDKAFGGEEWRDGLTAVTLAEFMLAVRRVDSSAHITTPANCSNVFVVRSSTKQLGEVCDSKELAWQSAYERIAAVTTPSVKPSSTAAGLEELLVTDESTFKDYSFSCPEVRDDINRRIRAAFELKQDSGGRMKYILVASLLLMGLIYMSPLEVLSVEK